jgi:hypothetical protein
MPRLGHVPRPVLPRQMRAGAVYLTPNPETNYPFRLSCRFPRSNGQFIGGGDKLLTTPAAAGLRRGQALYAGELRDLGRAKAKRRRPADPDSLWAESLPDADERELIPTGSHWPHEAERPKSRTC